MIYWVEDNKRYIDSLLPLFSSIHQGQKLAVSSYITLVEILTKPLAQKRKDLVVKYKELFLKESFLILAELDADSSEASAFFKAKYRLKTPDAIQLGLALAHQVDVFLTNDRRLKQVKEIPVVCLD